MKYTQEFRYYSYTLLGILFGLLVGNMLWADGKLVPLLTVMIVAGFIIKNLVRSKAHRTN